MSGISEYIDSEVKGNDVVVFMKGTPGFPQCGFSGQVVQILDYVGVDYKGVNVLTSNELRQGIKDYSNWPTIPQLYVKGEFVGGCDIIREMFQAGELQSLFDEGRGRQGRLISCTVYRPRGACSNAPVSGAFPFAFRNFLSWISRPLLPCRLTSSRFRAGNSSRSPRR